MTNMARITPKELKDFLVGEGIRRFYLVWDEKRGSVRASHPQLEPLARLLSEDRRDFDRHEGFFVQVAPETGVLQGASVHRTCRGQAAGGVRFWRYDTVDEYLRDGLRLARGMTHKNALAGLWWGGGKGVMAMGTGQDESDPAVRRRIYEEYGELMTSLRGCYVTAEDVGTSVQDMAAIFSRTRFTTCIPPELGGSGNPSAPTARGVVRGMEAALHFLGMGNLKGKTVAVQGLGHVGEPLVALLHERGVGKIVGSDIDPSREEVLRRRLPGLDLTVRLVERGDNTLLGETADIVSPCATGAILGPETIPRIRARIVCGAANNQLEDPETDDAALQDAGVFYMPDVLVNRMGIVNCADESFGYVDGDPTFEGHLGDTWDNSIYRLSLRILEEAQRTGQTPAKVALALAEERSFEAHPIWGHRGVQIIGSLVASDWARG
jgi:glutamate dehydrogenase/leucine dehydrogenase